MFAPFLDWYKWNFFFFLLELILKKTSTLFPTLKSNIFVTRSGCSITSQIKISFSSVSAGVQMKNLGCWYVHIKKETSIYYVFFTKIEHFLPRYRFSRFHYYRDFPIFLRGCEILKCYFSVVQIKTKLIFCNLLSLVPWSSR